MIVLSNEVFTENVIEFIRNEIKKNDYSEVTFVGNINNKGLVSEVEVIAYGNEESSPVILMEALQNDVLIHNHPGNSKDLSHLRASEADTGLASELANKKVGFFIIDNDCNNVNIIFKPQPRYYLNENEVKSIFDENGLLSQTITNFEPRKEQINLVSNIIDTINNSKILLAEAGTGTGKSLSYLIPSAIWSIKNKKRVIISTHTINLQQQIANKDMEIVKKVIKKYLKEEVHYSVLIGKSNYLCKKKLYELIKDKEKQSSLFTDDKDLELLAIIEEWTRNCTDGTLAEFGQYVKDELWEEICCESITCDRKKCKHFSDCFYYRARLQAEKSNIIIANHSLVFSSIDQINYISFLPFFSGIVIDEAHHCEDTVLKTRAQEFSIQSLLYILKKLYLIQKEKEFGLLPLLNKKAKLKVYPELEVLYSELIDIHKKIISQLNLLIDDELDNLKSWAGDNSTIGFENNFVNSNDYLNLKEKFNEIFNNISIYYSKFNDLANDIKEKLSDLSFIDVINYINFRLLKLLECKNIFDLIFESEKNLEYVKWIEIGKRNIKFFYSPLEVGDFLVNSLFNKKDFIIFTSATLTISNKFDYFKNSIGLNLINDREILEIKLDSPFDYKNQAEIYILDNELEHKTISREKIELIKELSLISEGGVLILYTSYQRMNETFEILKDTFIKAGLIPLKQGDETREELLKRMCQYSNIVLFATSSFWEGIDVQGDNLRCVIIEKLPFDSISDPIYKAKVELLESRNIPSFIYYSIPRAVLRLKQGIGRLIRSKTDKGVIAILDNRIKTQKYSQFFLNSLPPAKLISGSLKTIVLEAEKFFINKFTGE